MWSSGKSFSKYFATCYFWVLLVGVFCTASSSMCSYTVAMFVSCLNRIYCRWNRYSKDLLTYIGRKWISYKIYQIFHCLYSRCSLSSCVLLWSQMQRVYTSTLRLLLQSDHSVMCVFVRVASCLFRNPFWFIVCLRLNIECLHDDGYKTKEAPKKENEKRNRRNRNGK